MTSKVEELHPSAPVSKSNESISSSQPAVAALARRYPVGAEFVPSHGTHFRVWAPKSTATSVLIGTGKGFEQSPKEVALKREPNGYWSGWVADALPGMQYKYKLITGSFPDPASRFQPEGPHGPSQIVDPLAFSWADGMWKGVQRHGQIIYEMHIGTFTQEGTWKAACGQLQKLASLGVTLLELMPVADFPGSFGWGYDGVDLFAPTRLYGRPDDFRTFVNEAHVLGLGVILDVVYNHLGPDGNYLNEFSDDYFTDRYKNEWGEPLNFDGENNGPVRDFFASNAAYWVDEFHLDGLRLDATQQIFDSSEPNIHAEIVSAVRRAARGRATYIVGENEPQHARLARAPEQGGYGLDALWNDDFHHSAMVALTGRSEAYYLDYRGTPQEFISAAKWGYLYQGQWYAWQKKARGTLARDLAPEQFVNFLQNHDQIANSLHGARLHQLSHPGDFRALTALLLLSPGTPMLFQGQEFGASTPFFYFANHSPELARLVAKGRREFMRQFPTIACKESDPFIPVPDLVDTFQRSKLNFAERDHNKEFYQMTQDLIRLRKSDPVLSELRARGVDGAVLGPASFVLRYFADSGNDRLLLINLGQDQNLSPVPEPLLAPPTACDWSVGWSSEAPAYGGCGTPPFRTNEEWRLLGHSAIVLIPESTAELAESPAPDTARHVQPGATK